MAVSHLNSQSSPRSLRGSHRLLIRSHWASGLAADVKSITDALADEDSKGAFRTVDGGLQLAPEAKAMKVLPTLYPAAVKPLPTAAGVQP